jgi:hypothetical protein
MLQNGLSLILLAGFVIGIIFLLQWIWRRPLSTNALPDWSPESGESVVKPRPLMSQEEATLYNLIKLAAQESLLVLAKIPVLHVLSFGDKDEEARKAVMRAIQPVRCDIVLVHPGTLTATTVVFFQKISSSGSEGEDRGRLVETLLKAAGIKTHILQFHTTYSVEQLSKMLGLDEEE